MEQPASKILKREAPKYILNHQKIQQEKKAIHEKDMKNKWKDNTNYKGILQTKCTPLRNQEFALSPNLESNCFEVFLLKFYLCSHARMGNKAVKLMFHFRWNASIFCAGTHLWDSLECRWRTHLEMTVPNLWRLMFPLCPWYDQTTFPPKKGFECFSKG